MEEKNPLNYNSDEWIKLFKDDPQLFNQKRREAIENMIAAAPKERQIKLRTIQWQIDKRLNGSKTPLGRMMIMQTIFYDAVYLPSGLLHQLRFHLEQLAELVRGCQDEQLKLPKAKPQLKVVR